MPSSNRLSVLIVDSDHRSREVTANLLRENNTDVHGTASAESALSRLSNLKPDIIITELRLPEMSGLELLRTVNQRSDNNTPVIMVSARFESQDAMNASNAGVLELLNKPIDPVLLRKAIATAASIIKHRDATRVAPSNFEEKLVLGSDQQMLEVARLIALYAKENTTVLITGETGTGKELVARAIHQQSRHRDQPYVAINCAALPKYLIESELFGYVRGAFTGAVAERSGYLSAAGCGTIVFDEIAKASSTLCEKLLRVLQERTFRCLGSNKLMPLHARVIAITNRNLAELVTVHGFPDDLYHRLNVATITVPPLRERSMTDLLELAEYFIEKAAAYANRKFRPTLTPDALTVLKCHTWPGNIRELEHCICRAVIRATHDVILPEHLNITTAEPDHRTGTSISSEAFFADGSPTWTLEEAKQVHAKRVLHHTTGNKTRACEILGVTRPTLDRILTNGLV